MHKSILFVGSAVVGAATAFGAAAVKPEPTLVDTSSSAGQVVDQSAAYDTTSTYRAAKAFDRVFSTMNSCWISKFDADNPVAFFVYEFNTPTVVDCIRLQNSEKWGETTRAPKNWTFEGSNDTNNWVVLDTQTGHTGWTSNEFRTCSFVNKNAYKYYKYNCTANNGATWVALCEVEFLAGSVANIARNAGAIDQDLSSPVVTASGASYPASKLFDGIRKNNGSRWLCAKADHMYFVYEFNTPTCVNAMTLCTPGASYGWDSRIRAPTAWKFFGSNDGATWTELDDETETGWSDNPESRYYEFSNSTKYRYYKFDATAINGSTEYLQLDEVEFHSRYDGLPVFGDCSVTRTAATSLLVSAVLDTNGADTLSYILNDGEAVTTNAFATSVGEGQTGTATISGLSEDKTYEVSILAENAAGTAVYPAGSFYTGELTLGAVVNASEDTLAPGTVAVSRASADNVPLTVYYTITGTTGSQGTTWAEPVGVVIPAGSTTGYLLVTPLADLAVSENIEVAVSLVPGNYDIPASGNSATLTIENDDTPEGWTVVTIVNAFDNPAGGYLGANYEKALTNTSNRIIRFTKPEDAPAGLREFAQWSGSQWTQVYSGESNVTRDWMMSFSGSTPTNAATVSSIACATQAGALTGLGRQCDSRVYTGSWCVPADGTYSFRLHMGYPALFSLDGKLILRQATGSAVTTNGVPLTAGWHSFYAAFVSNGSGNIGPASGETLGFSFSASNAETPDTPFTSGNCQFSTAFSAVLTPSMVARADVMVDCSNVLGDLRVAGQLWATSDHKFSFVNIPAGGALEFGSPVYSPSGLHGWQNLYNFAFVDWTQLSIPSGVGIRFEGAVVVNDSWTQAGHGTWSGDDRSAFSLGNNAIIAVQVPNFFGTAGAEEFLIPDGLRYFQFGQPSVIGDTATIKTNSVNQLVGIGIGGAPFIVENNALPVKIKYTNNHNFYNDFDIGNNGSINHTMPWFSSDILHGDVLSGNIRATGWGRRLQTRGRLNVRELNEGQRADFFVMRPREGTAPSFINTVTLSSDGTQYPTSGWQYTGASAYYFPEIPGENPLSIGTLTGSDAFWYPGSPHHGGRRGATFSTCSNNVVNVAKLAGSGIHLRILRPNSSGSSDATNDEKGEDGPANFVFGEINGLAGMKVFVSSNVNVTVTNIVKKAAFHYEMMSNSVNKAVLDIEGTVADGTTITATDIAMLPSRIKGFTGNITLTETNQTGTVTYPVVFDFDNHGGVPVGGCDGSGNLVAAPLSGHIELTLAGTPVRGGTWGILCFDNANGKLDNWTINAPETYGNYEITVTKGANGFTMQARRKGLAFFLR